MSASPPLRQPCPPGACVCERERAEAPGADRRILLLTRQEEQRGRSLEALRSTGRHGTPAAAHGGTTGHPPADRPGLRRGAQHARHPHALRGAAGLCRKTRQAIPAAIRRGWRSARKSPTPCSTPMTCCATPEGTERQEEDVAQDLGGLPGVSADNAHGVIRPTGRSGCRRAPGPPESLAGLATAPGSARRLRLHVAEHRLQAEQAGIAQGAQFVEADAGEDFHAAQRIGAAQGLLQLAGTAGGRWRQRWKRCP